MPPCYPKFQMPLQGRKLRVSGLKVSRTVHHGSWRKQMNAYNCYIVKIRCGRVFEESLMDVINTAEGLGAADGT